MRAETESTEEESRRQAHYFEQSEQWGQVDLIDMQSEPNGEFKHILNYQDHLTKFVFLKPLKTKTGLCFQVM